MQRPDTGSAVVYIVLMSTSIFIILIALLNQASVIFQSSYDRYYQQLAREAAEAGLSYASACLNRSNNIQTWGAAASGGARPDLSPPTSCDGGSASPSLNYLLDNGDFRTSFIVGNLESLQPNSAQISATGTTELLSDGGSVIETYTQVLKKTIVWPTDFSPQPLAAGSNHTCAVRSGSVYCWGYNRYGQLGNNQSIGSGDIETSSSADSLTPDKVTGLLADKTVSELFAAQNHSCALADGSVYCWGDNTYGQLGNGTAGNYSATPVLVAGALAGKTVTAVGGSGNTSCAIALGKIYCWGMNSISPDAVGVVGVNDPTTSYYNTPQEVTAGNTSTTLQTSYVATELSSTGTRSFNMCAIADDQAYCWGNNDRGAVGDDTTTDRLLPTKVLQEAGVLSGKKITAIAHDGFAATTDGPLAHVCAIATDTSGNNGQVYCWGDNTHGQLGDGTTVQSLKPVAVRANIGDQLYNKTVTSLTTGLRHSCAVADDKPYCWGNGSNGQLGNSSTANSSVAVAVTEASGSLAGQTTTVVDGGPNKSCALTSSGKVFCWGLNNLGQLGDSTTVQRDQPTEALYLRPPLSQYYF